MAVTHGPERPEAGPVTDEPAVADPVGSADPVRVLVADDDRGLLLVVTTLCASQPGLSAVGTATDAAEAVQQAAELQPDVVLLDVRLPGGGGLAAIPVLVEVAPSCRVVMHSADTGTRAAALAAGAHDWIAKGESVDVIGVRLIAAGSSIDGRARLRHPAGSGRSAAGSNSTYDPTGHARPPLRLVRGELDLEADPDGVRPEPPRRS
jgi:DNA-binding NarL/FixJ family response regulator